MQVPVTRRIALLFTVALAACDAGVTSTGFGGGTTATVRVANASSDSLDVASAGSVANGNGGLLFGVSSTCTSTDAAAPDLTVRKTGTGSVLTGFPTSFAVGAKYLVVAYSANGVTQFATFPTNTFTPGSGQSGLTVFDAASGTGNVDVYVTPTGSTAGTPSATNLSFGSSANFFNVAAGSEAVVLTNTGTQTVVFTAGSVSLSAGRNYVLVIAPPSTGTTALRSFLVTSC